jgi:hypothetical protein
MTVASFPGDVCPLRHSKGDVFTEVQKFSWKWIVGVNPLPRGASVGELGKTLTPSKHRIIEIHETGSRKGWYEEILSVFRMFHKSLDQKRESNGRTRPLYSNF